MKTFTKRGEVIEHFVANGIHAGIAKALVTEYYDWGNYNSNPDYKEEGLLQRINDDDVCEAATLTEEEADQFLRVMVATLKLGWTMTTTNVFCSTTSLCSTSLETIYN